MEIKAVQVFDFGMGGVQGAEYCSKEYHKKALLLLLLIVLAVYVHLCYLFFSLVVDILVG